MNKELLINLHQAPEFKLLLAEIRKARPVIPAYDPDKQNIEQIKVKSGEQRGFDAVLGIMAPWGEKEV